MLEAILMKFEGASYGYREGCFGSASCRASPEGRFQQGRLVDELKKALSERILNTELDEHLAAENAGDNANHRNGYSKKSVLTATSKVTLAVPRDRAGIFDPQLRRGEARRRPCVPIAAPTASTIRSFREAMSGRPDRWLRGSS